ncbi:hypothetical protein QAD02_006110 [Eretmocerus hayati]|uniref:Uncharacterized protein n=1 Tax=Eretmocerus hayati TaxID=131215 RepID=A0ACC2N032_9HYME|nr:hypothetical protein QAD02_006110 [Eretmocerus hayati]
MNPTGAALEFGGSKSRPPDRFDIDKYQEIQSSRSLLPFAQDRLQQLVNDEFEKRAAMRGFQGMRGKKSAYDSLGDYYYYKRAPMGFQGMRGKKDFSSDYGESDKRAPMGFQGMRGKKSYEEVLEDSEKRAMMGFQGMRGKKMSEDYDDTEWLDGEWLDKRAPMGFQGMRGKKASSFDELYKRAPMGFQGMRGKKDMFYDHEDFPESFDSEKRALLMGFHGSRGKRSINSYDEAESRPWQKRSVYRFFGSRGKKNPRWELRGKFVGVRGKKWSPSLSQQPPSVYQDLALVNGDRTRRR